MDNITNLAESEKCIHYAKFARGLTIVNFDTLYWILFTSVIMLLFYASTTYDKCIKAASEFSPGSNEHRKQMIRCMAICGLCTVVAVVAVVMETFALLALQFCDGADLMMLYWSTWTMLQIGSVIAIFGIMLSVFHVLRERKAPAWGLALGTPVLVVAGLGHFFHDCVYKRVKAAIIKKREQGQGTVSISQSSTLRASTPPPNGDGDKVVARFIGHTSDGGTIIELTGDVRSIPETDKRIGTGINGQALIACGSGSEMARLVLAAPKPGSAPAAIDVAHRAPPVPSGASSCLTTTVTNDSQRTALSYPTVPEAAHPAHRPHWQSNGLTSDPATNTSSTAGATADDPRARSAG